VGKVEFTGRVRSISISSKRGEKKKNVKVAILRKNYGILKDAHAKKDSLRQVSLLMWESIKRMRRRGLEVKEGSFAENITTEGINLRKLKKGDRIFIGENVILEVSKIGKECLSPCSIYKRVGYCIMPKEGIFAKVLKGGKIKVGDKITFSHLVK